jgi:intracellular sulfur oxidation DsrE/DsrF family protein
LIAGKDKIPVDAARKKAESFLVPGVSIVPSGVFAVIRAQEAGCAYVRAS